MVAISLEVLGDEVVGRELLRMGQRAGDTKPVLNAMADDFFRMEKQIFDSEGAGGSAGTWRPLKPATLAAKARKGQDMRRLRADGHLYRAMTSRGAAHQQLTIDNEGMTLAIDLPYRNVHQKGYGNIPARPYVALTEKMKRSWTKRLQRWVITGQVQSGPES